MNSTFINGRLTGLLLQLDRQLGARLAQLEQSVARGSTATPSSMPLGTSPQLPVALVDGVNADLANEVRVIRDAAAALRELSSETLQQFTYAMAAWVDETLVRKYRDRMPPSCSGAVENELFETRDAGEQVFVHMDLVLARRSNSDSLISGVYLLMLGLGFCGRHASSDKRELLEQYRRGLATMALNPDSIEHPDNQIEAPAPTQEHGGAFPARLLAALQPMRVWMVTALIWLAAGLVIDWFWGQITIDMHRAVLQVQNELPRPAVR